MILPLLAAAYVTAGVIGVVVLVFLVFVLLGGMLANVGGQQVGLIERRYFGKPLPESRVVAMRGEIGIQARVLQPGLHFLPPFIYKVSKDDMLVIAEDQVGLIESIDGRPLDPSHIFGRHVESHDTFQDGEGFLRNGGQKGPQVDILPPGKYRINTYLFRVRAQPALIVAQGQVGVVSARDGNPIKPGRLLAQHVDEAIGVGGFIGLDQPNLFGQCKRGSLQWQFGSFINDFNLSYTDPAIRLSRVSGTLTAYRSQNRYQIADLGSFTRIGGSAQLGFPVPGSYYSRIFASYGAEVQSFGSGGLTSTLQALVFTVLSTIYFLLMLPHHDHEPGHGAEEALLQPSPI